MASGGVFFVTFKTNHPVIYQIGIFLFLALGIVLSICGFAGLGGGMGLGIVGAVVALGALILLIEYYATRRPSVRHA